MTNSPLIKMLIAMAGGIAIEAASLAASDSIPVCPSHIRQSSVVVKDVDAGWKPYVAAPLYLHSVAPIDGPPERLGALIGKRVRTERDSWVDIYELQGSFPDGKWLQCSYGMLNEVVLSKRLNDDIASCTVKGKKGEKAGQNVFSVECR